MAESRRKRLRKRITQRFELRRRSDDAGNPKGLRSQIRAILQSTGPLRLAATSILLLLALTLARFGWELPVVDDVERLLFDYRATYSTQQVEPDDRIVLVVYNEDTLFDTQVRSPVDREVLARALTNLNAMDTRGIAIDILFDQPTPNDEQLIAALSAMNVPTFIAQVSSEYNPNTITERQERTLDDFFGRIGNDNVDFTSVFFQTDDDDVMRRWPDQPANLPPLMANALAPGFDAWRDYRGSVVYRAELYEGESVFPTFPIQDVADPMVAEFLAEAFEDRYVLIGADLQDRDRFDTPLSMVAGGNANTTAGVAVHAHMLAQMLDENMLTPVPVWVLWVTGFLVVLAGSFTSMGEFRLWKLGLFILLQIAFIVAVPALLHEAGTDTRGLPVVGWILGWIIAFTAVGAAARSIGAEKRQFVQGALGKYLPRDVADQLISNPDRLSLHGEKREIYAIFTDLEGFTKLSHAIEPEQVAHVLNSYLDELSDVVLEHGGTLDKYVGDAVVAFWGAPISRPDDAERAARCALAMWEKGEEFRAGIAGGIPPVGRTRVGLHFGEAVVGNFGGQDRIQYTALGDAMNTAARLESANKHLDTSILASREAIDNVSSIEYRTLGRVTLSGRSTPVEIFEPVRKVTKGSADSLHKLYRKFEEGDKKAADEIAALARSNPDDAALQNFAERLRQTEPGGTYVLQAK